MIIQFYWFSVLVKICFRVYFFIVTSTIFIPKWLEIAAEITTDFPFVVGAVVINDFNLVLLFHFHFMDFTLFGWNYIIFIDCTTNTPKQTHLHKFSCIASVIIHIFFSVLIVRAICTGNTQNFHGYLSCVEGIFFRAVAFLLYFIAAKYIDMKDLLRIWFQ